ncbi:MAG: D-2-hydroxyacid dehydrogenase [Planctomycetaceae bacterium]|nr:D-2-hydroxyacid dehydrogenase [Planctomycetaceae bacterium]
MKLVIYPPVEAARLDKIQTAAGSMRVVNARDAAHAAAEIVDADGFFGKITPDLLALAPQLRWVQSPTASLEHYLFPELVTHPCLLSNMRGLFSDVIADHVMGMVIAFARNLHVYIRQQMQRRWEPVGGESGRSDFVSGPGVASAIDLGHRHLADCTLGIVGVGAIGREIAHRAHAFGMTILGVDPQCRELPGVIADVWNPARLPELLAASDFVVIAAPHTPETHKLFRIKQFEQMRRSAYLINVGRGVIVDLADLTEALQRRLIAGAGLDVFETEPLPPDHPLWGFENVIITPHIAGTSPRIAQRHLETLLENIRCFVDGKPPVTLVDKTRWY